MLSNLEQHVLYDMYINGYDPQNKQHIQLYWEERLK